MQKFIQYLKDVRAEMAKVSWPTRTSYRATTLVVALSIAVSLFVYACDQILVHVVGFSLNPVCNSEALMASRWYVVHAYSGQESKVHQYLNELIQSGEMNDQIKQVLMPTQDVVQVKNGKKLKTTRKFFPSYVLVEMELSKETMHLIRNTAGVTGFVGGNKPQALREEEVRRILGQTEKISRQQISEVPFEIGDAVKIKEGIQRF